MFEICEEMIQKGNPNSITDAAVGVLCARAAVIGAYLNVKINAADLEDKAFAEKMIGEAEEYVEKAKAKEAELMETVRKAMA